MIRDHARPDGAGAPEAAAPPVRAPSHAERCRTLTHGALVGSLATVAREPAGCPYVSLVTVAFDGEGRPLLLLSSLAEHTANIDADERTSLLVAEAMDPLRDPLALGRMTIVGRCRRVSPAEVDEVKTLFLAAQPRSAAYVEYRDFAFYRLEPESIRYIGGFGRMSWVRGEDYRAAAQDPLAAFAAGILAHMNGDHADAVLAYATHLAGIPTATSATLTAVDRYGFELTATTPEGPRAARLAFATECTTTDAVRGAMVALVHEARGRAS